MYDSGRGSSGTLCCGGEFLWSYQVIGAFAGFVVQLDDYSAVNCMGCIANDLG